MLCFEQPVQARLSPIWNCHVVTADNMRQQGHMRVLFHKHCPLLWQPDGRPTLRFNVLRNSVPVLKRLLANLPTDKFEITKITGWILGMCPKRILIPITLMPIPLIPCILQTTKTSLRRVRAVSLSLPEVSLSLLEVSLSLPVLRCPVLNDTNQTRITKIIPLSRSF